MTIGEIMPVYITYRQSLGEKFKTNRTVLTGFFRHVGPDVKLELINWNIISEYLYGSKGKVTSF